MAVGSESGLRLVRVACVCSVLVGGFIWFQFFGQFENSCVVSLASLCGTGQGRINAVKERLGLRVDLSKGRARTKMHIEKLILLAADLESLRAFYGDRLGMSVTLNDDTRELAVTVGSTQLIFQDAPDFEGCYHFAWNIPENRIGACQRFLRERSIPPIEDINGETLFDFEFWDAHAIYFYDGAGNIGECIARHELPNSSVLTDEAPFSSEEFLCVSEIGFPCDEPPAVASALKQHCQIDEYRDGSPTFLPIGDANGLFILVKAGREWYPNTGIAAHPHPLQITFRNDASLRWYTMEWPEKDGVPGS